ncbi:hypothetical protein BH09MYX1_BH09MYX1_18140 [soil metagenome]
MELSRWPASVTRSSGPVRFAVVLCFAACVPAADASRTETTTISTDDASAEAASPIASFRADLRASRLEREWEPSPESGLPFPPPSGSLIGHETSPGTRALLPRAAILLTKPQFPVDLDAAIDAIESLARRTFSDREREMKDALEARKHDAPKGSLTGAVTDVVYAFAYLALDGQSMTFIVRRTMIQPIGGPLIKAPDAPCPPGQACAPTPDERRDLSAAIAVQARYVLSIKGSLVEDTLFAPHTIP